MPQLLVNRDRPFRREVLATERGGTLQEFRAGALTPGSVSTLGELVLVELDVREQRPLPELLDRRRQGLDGDTQAGWTVFYDELAASGSAGVVLARLDVHTGGPIGRAEFRILFDALEQPAWLKLLRTQGNAMILEPELYARRHEVDVVASGLGVTNIPTDGLDQLMVLATVTDPDGRPVELTRERWGHIVHSPGKAGHPELEPYRADILRAVSKPDRRVAGRETNEEWFLLEGVGPSRWLHVVVAFEAGRGWIVTAFPRRSFPSAP